MDKQITSPLFSVEEAARYLNTSKKEIRSLIHIGAVRYVKLGKGWRVMRSDLDVWLAKNLRTEGQRAAA